MAKLFSKIVPQDILDSSISNEEKLALVKGVSGKPSSSSAININLSDYEKKKA
jgi:hypothetical protein